jgi:hypothetical protein
MKRIATLFAALALTLTAQAQSRTVDFTQVIKGLDGTPFTVTSGADAAKKAEQLTLGDVAVNALETVVPDDVKLSGEDKFKLDLLARKVYKAKSAALTGEEVNLLKQRIGKLYGATIVGVAWRMLDPEAK